MSASDKKKLRKEQVSAILTERQKQEQAEAKKLKLYTIGFIAIMLVIACVGIGVLGYQAVTQSGIIERATTAAVVDGNKLSTVDMNYYYYDAINEFRSDLSAQAQGYEDYYLQEQLKLNPNLPVTEQINPETGKPWSEYFMEKALENAKSDFAFAKAAKAANFTLPEEDRATLDSMVSSLELYAQAYGVANANKFLQGTYGFGSNVKNYMAYLERCALADAYIAHHHDSLSFTKKDYSKYDKDVNNFNAYTYDCLYLSYTDFLTGEATESNAEERNNAAREAARLAAEKLATCTTLDELKAMAETIEVSKNSKLAVQTCINDPHTKINSNLSKWLADSARKDGELACITNVGTDNETINGYYIAIFHSKCENTTPMANVRHLLVKFTGGKLDEDTKVTVYSDDEKAAAMAKAEEYLKKWKDGKADEAAFIELVKAHSEDTASVPDGGLYENLYAGSGYEPNFENWAIDPTRKQGDTGIVETSYGYHIMYYVDAAELSYRDSMIDAELRDEQHTKWCDEILAPVTSALKNTSRVNTAQIIGAFN